MQIASPSASWIAAHHMQSFYVPSHLNYSVDRANFTQKI